MGIFARSFFATIVAIPVLYLFYNFLFPSSGNDAFIFMSMAVFFLGIPLFLVMFVAIAVLSKSSDPNAIDSSDKNISARRLRSIFTVGSVGVAIAGVLALLISGIIWQVWLVCAAVGGILGAIAGIFRKL
jgi:hypothetical protein